MFAWLFTVSEVERKDRTITLTNESGSEAREASGSRLWTPLPEALSAPPEMLVRAEAAATPRRD
ncbi:hypothetical protein Slala05_77520 [Streptomyces lavendulae subsp. lavendulae]|nr:hypothetical protein Slala05_77520 [Streptomyces lavendulae subsp. lavendulae]